jgi:hypothetical protein
MRGAWLAWTVVAAVAWGCSDSVSPSSPVPPLTAGDGGRGTDGSIAPLPPGEVCSPTNSTPLSLSFDPSTLILSPGMARPVTVTVQPDICAPLNLTLSMGNAKIAAAPSQGTIDLQHPSFSFDLTGNAMGTTTLTASMKRPTDTAPTTVELPIVVQSGAAATCTTGDSTAGTMSSNAPLVQGTASLSLASIYVDEPMGVAPGAAFTRTDEFGLPSIPVKIQCTGDDLTQAKNGHPAAPGELVAIGPAVTFTSSTPASGSPPALDMTQSLRRELDFTIPVNPATIPPGGRLRHLEVLFMSPGGAGVAKTPRIMTIGSPRIYPTGSGYALHFSSPWFGTYQAVFPVDAGTSWRTRHLTHRAVVGISMGSGGAATFGMRHHNQFDVIGPMGGPSDWTWLVWFIRAYALGGFCPTTDPLYPNCTTYTPNLYPFQETYAHTVDFNHWWYQIGGGNGGTFGRNEYTQIFDDLSIMLGNANGQNADPTLAFFPAGPTADDLWVKGQATGLPPGVDCRITVSPLSTDANYAEEQMWQSQCAVSRCSNPWIAPTGYYDRNYNPDGSQQVISFCDGNQDGTTPYVDTYAGPGGSTAAAAYAGGNNQPNDVALAVDLNGNGVRDVGEPVLNQGNEPWSDTGTDGLFDVDEPGYDPVTNPDPNQDDYDFQLNPSGTENDHRFEAGEPYLDYGLDGVKGTKQQSMGGYDVGEGDGKFTMAQGLQNFYAVDPHSILAGWSTAIPGGPMTDSELLRFDVWSDGGVRDLFNFEAVANHLEGAIAARKQSDGTPLRQTAFFNGFDKLPGQVWDNENAFSAYNMVWPDLVDDPSLRYGTIDATPAMIADGDGQHVGTANQLLDRITTSLFYVGQRWPDADRTVTEETETPANPNCSPGGLCSFNFTGPVTGRTGPIIVQLPPGYAVDANAKRNVRYPVVYVLHGYGMTPAGLEAVAILSTNFMNDSSRSSATRIPKFILVYVDGRCRIGKGGFPECIEGTFWLNSNRPEGAQMDSWFDEVVDYMDQNYRTMGPSDVSVLE